MSETSFTSAESERSNRLRVAAALYGLQLTYAAGVTALRQQNTVRVQREFAHLHNICAIALEEPPSGLLVFTSRAEREYIGHAATFYERRLRIVQERAEKTGHVREYFWDGGWPRPQRVRDFCDESAPLL